VRNNALAIGAANNVGGSGADLRGDALTIGATNNVGGGSADIGGTTDHHGNGKNETGHWDSPG